MNSREKTRTRIPLPDGRVLYIDDSDDTFVTCLMLDGEKFIPAFHYYIKCSELDEQAARLDRIILEKGEFALRNQRLFNEVVSLGKRIATLEKENVEIENKYQALDKIMVDIVAKYIGSST